MHEITDIITRLDFLTEKAEGLTRDIRVLSNDVRQFYHDSNTEKRE